MKIGIIYADLLRIIATFAVIVLHVSASKWYDTPVKDFNWQIYNLYDSLVRWAVPIFVMLSGMFFLNPEKFIPTSNIIKKYIFRILLAIIVWGLFYQAYEIIGKFIFKNESITFKISWLSQKFRLVRLGIIFGIFTCLLVYIC